MSVTELVPPPALRDHAVVVFSAYGPPRSSRVLKDVILAAAAMVVAGRALRRSV